MARIERWDSDESCIRFFKTKATAKYEEAGMIYPVEVSEKELYDLPKHVGETYEQCVGTVRVHGYYDGGMCIGSDDDYPPEGESFVDECNDCGYSTWTEEEIAAFEKQAKDG